MKNFPPQTRMQGIFIFLLMFSAFGLGCLAVLPQSIGSNPGSLGRTDEIVLPEAHSFLLRDVKTKVNYRIYIALPQGYGSSTKRYPILLTLDADGTFSLLTQAYRLLRIDQETPDLILVGIGYEMKGPARRTQRERDLTPTRARPDSASGDASAFLAFIAGTLISTIESRYRTDPTDRAIFGHSLGGLFALYVLFERPDIFRRYIVSSPAIWWDKAVILRHETRFSSNRTELAKSIFVSVGSNEAKDMLEYFQPFADALRSRRYSRLEFSSVLLPDETHLTAFSAGFLRGIRKVYRKIN